MSQAAAILSVLKDGRTITPLEAYERFGCLALHSRIAELRRVGHRIACQIVTANGKRWGQYRLEA